MRMLAFLLAIICVIAAIVYLVMPAGSLPPFMPGFEGGSAHVHFKHGAIAAVAAVILLFVGFMLGRSRRTA